jgi:hypothetical protein
MAFSQHEEAITGVANSDFSAAQYRIVEMTSAAFTFDLSAAGQGYGVLKNHPKAGEAATVIIEGRARCQAGSGGVAVGDYITGAASGFATKVNSGDKVKLVGRAFTAAASGSVFALDVERGGTGNYGE